jgi:murein DD-endopeptidase MepM/ murein hydrolase activator NlpD
LTKSNQSKKQAKVLTLASQPATKNSIPRLPSNILKGIAFLVCFLMAYMIGAFLHDRQTTPEVIPVDATVQEKELDSLTLANASIQADLQKLTSLDTEITQLAISENITPPPQLDVTHYTGQGGPLLAKDSKDVNQLATTLQGELKIREQRLVDLKQEILKKQENLATTPSMWPVKGDVTSRFGWRASPWGSGSDYHPGIDIANNMGTPVFATADGEVVRGEWSDGYGNLVQIDHRNGIATLYGHNSQIIVHNGQLVKKGQVIAYLGSTGNSTGPHVHYEVRVNGTAVNPETFLMRN